MTYKNVNHSRRMVVIPVVVDAFANLFKNCSPVGASTVPLYLSDPQVQLSVEPDGASDHQRHVYNLPFLINREGLPWNEANSFFLDLVEGEHIRKRPTERARRKAAHLLDYKLFCEKNDIDWLDFTARRRSNRPTYRYFRYLLDEVKIGPGSVNQRTGTIYQFYKYVAAKWHDIDIDRVDTCKDFCTVISTDYGNQLIANIKRSQTVRRSASSEVRSGFVRENGEELRPLTTKELQILLGDINGVRWSQLERLVIKTALTTGARKQSILTLRLRHLKIMLSKGPEKDGTFKLHIGPGSGVDTKFDKKQVLHFPAKLINELSVFAFSKLNVDRRRKFTLRFQEQFPDLTTPRDEDIYLFLSEQGNCYYMSKSDLRYPYVKSPPIGQMTDNLKRKLLTSSPQFPADFSFHWLRASFGYLIYQWLLPFIQNGTLKIGEEIQIIQRRMHHKNRETTENYLKLYSGLNEKIYYQEIFESTIFNWATDLAELEGSEYEA